MSLAVGWLPTPTAHKPIFTTMEYLFGVLLLFVFGVVTWCVSSEGAWGAGLTFLCVLFAGLLAMNFFEPVAGFIETTGGGFLRNYADLLALVGLFAGFTFLLRMGAEYLSPTDIQVESRLYHVARWLFAAAAGYTTMAILLTALHTAPLPREFIGFKPEARNLIDISAPDRQWLGFVQHVSERVLQTGRVFDGTDETQLHRLEGVNQRYWPSFALRYASRREGRAKGSGAGGGSPTQPGPPPTGGGSNNAAF